MRHKIWQKLMKSDMTKTNITLPRPPHPIWPSSPGSQSARQRHGWSVDSLWWFLLILNREDGDMLLRYWHPWNFQNKIRQDENPHCDVSAHKESADDVAYDLCISLAFEKQNVSIMSACFLITNLASTVPLQWQSLTSSFHTLPIINKKR